ncbi:MAG: Zn-dependent alcohol dehydrogenase [Dehalococcoidales bacterium]|nr:Zn-dependent alcohol dehydrogenase [Dehalococcoidales bacterium]
MKAAVCYEYGKPLVIEDLDIDPPGPGEVKVKMAATAVCHSDIHIIKGELPFPLPVVVGHESSGWVEEIGEGVTNVKVGDPVVASLLISCGKCKFCTTGRTHLCEATWPRDTQSPFKNKKGEPINQAIKIGSFAEYTIVHESQCVKIPDDMPMDRASLLACGVITGFGAVVWRAKPEVASSCVIIGIGGVGLNSVQGAALCGAYPVIAVDVNDSKLEAARTFGATHVVNARNGDPVEAVKALTEGRGADYVFVTVGAIEAMSQGIAMSGPRGMTVWVGLPKFTDQAPIAPFTLIRDERTVTGSYMGTTNLQRDIPKLVELYKAGKLKLDELITKHYKLEEINEAIKAVEDGKALRNIIMFT